MDNSLQIFNYNGTKIRTVEKDGQAWFIAKDVCNVLEISKYRDAITKLDDDERVSVKMDTLGGEQIMTAISESGVYFLAFRSNKPEAKAFARWVRKEVLPDIHKHGMYLSPEAREAAIVNPETFNAVVKAYVAEHDKVLSLQAKIDAMTPKAVLGDMVLALPGAICFGEAAKFYRQRGLDIGRNRLIHLCVDLGWLCKQKCQLYKPSQKGIEKGVVNIEIDANGCIRFTDRPMLTSKGVQELYKVLLITQRPIEFLLLQGETEN